MNNKIENEKVNVPCGKCMNDKDYANSLLSCLKELVKNKLTNDGKDKVSKDLVKNYAKDLTEASNEVLYNKYKEMFDTYASMQRDVFESMFRMGWYKLEKADNNKICEKQQMLIQELNSINS